jgi:hypothetical protein
VELRGIVETFSASKNIEKVTTIGGFRKLLQVIR